MYQYLKSYMFKITTFFLNLFFIYKWKDDGEKIHLRQTFSLHG